MPRAAPMDSHHCTVSQNGRACATMPGRIAVSRLPVGEGCAASRLPVRYELRARCAAPCSTLRPCPPSVRSTSSHLSRLETGWHKRKEEREKGERDIYLGLTCGTMYKGVMFSRFAGVHLLYNLEFYSLNPLYHLLIEKGKTGSGGIALIKES